MPAPAANETVAESLVVPMAFIENLVWPATNCVKQQCVVMYLDWLKPAGK
jgi:hypothetical protein